MDWDDPYDRHYQALRDDGYWTNRIQDIKDDYEFASKYRDSTIQRDITLQQEAGKFTPARKSSKAEWIDLFRKEPAGVVVCTRTGHTTYDCLTRDREVRGWLADGVLTRDTIRKHIENRLNEIAEKPYLTPLINIEIGTSRSMLSGMEEMKADGLDYLSDQLAGLSQHLKRVAVELLSLDNLRGDFSSAITRTIIDNARSRCYEISEPHRRETKLQEIDELVKNLVFE
jgi:hypothetical protein